MRDTTGVPYRWICALDRRYPDPDDASLELSSRGSGTLIGTRHVLTAGHNMKDCVTGSKGTRRRLTVRRANLTPGLDGARSTASARAPYGTSAMSSFKAHPRWLSSGEHNHDYAVVTLARPLGAAPLGYWGSAAHGAGTRLAVIEPKIIAAASVNVSGYPADKCGTRPSVGSASDAMLASCSFDRWASTQWRSYARVRSASSTDPRIAYELDTFGGHTGSPVWLRWRGVRTLIALHTQNSGGRGFNYGVRISAEVLANVKAWCR